MKPNNCLRYVIPLYKKKGAALLEFVLLFPLYLLIFLGVIDFSLLFFNTAVLKNASQRSARYGIIKLEGYYPKKDQIIQFSENITLNYLVSFSEVRSNLDTIVIGPESPKSGDSLKLMLVFDYHHLPFFKLIGLPESQRITSTTVMKYE